MTNELTKQMRRDMQAIDKTLRNALSKASSEVEISRAETIAIQALNALLGGHPYANRIIRNEISQGLQSVGDLVKNKRQQLIQDNLSIKSSEVASEYDDEKSRPAVEGTDEESMSVFEDEDSRLESEEDEKQSDQEMAARSLVNMFNRTSSALDAYSKTVWNVAASIVAGLGKSLSAKKANDTDKQQEKDVVHDHSSGAESMPSEVVYTNQQLVTLHNSLERGEVSHVEVSGHERMSVEDLSSHPDVFLAQVEPEESTLKYYSTEEYVQLDVNDRRVVETALVAADVVASGESSLVALEESSPDNYNRAIVEARSIDIRSYLQDNSERTALLDSFVNRLSDNAAVEIVSSKGVSSVSLLKLLRNPSPHYQFLMKFHKGANDISFRMVRELPSIKLSTPTSAETSSTVVVHSEPHGDNTKSRFSLTNLFSLTSNIMAIVYVLNHMKQYNLLKLRPEDMISTALPLETETVDKVEAVDDLEDIQIERTSSLTSSGDESSQERLSGSSVPETQVQPDTTTHKSRMKEVLKQIKKEEPHRKDTVSLESSGESFRGQLSGSSVLDTKVQPDINRKSFKEELALIEDEPHSTRTSRTSVSDESSDKNAPIEQDEPIEALKQAVDTAYKHYRIWLLTNKNEEKNYSRGDFGRFTTQEWRHGKEKGLTNATSLNESIGKQHEFGPMVKEINQTLRSSNMNRHSFGSFLLDELRKSDELREHDVTNLWSDIKIGEKKDNLSWWQKDPENLYSKADVKNWTQAMDDLIDDLNQGARLSR